MSAPPPRRTTHRGFPAPDAPKPPEPREVTMADLAQAVHDLHRMVLMQGRLIAEQNAKIDAKNAKIDQLQTEVRALRVENVAMRREHVAMRRELMSRGNSLSEDVASVRRVAEANSQQIGECLGEVCKLATSHKELLPRIFDCPDAARATKRLDVVELEVQRLKGGVRDLSERVMPVGR